VFGDDEGQDPQAPDRAKSATITCSRDVEEKLSKKGSYIHVINGKGGFLNLTQKKRKREILIKKISGRRPQKEGGVQTRHAGKVKGGEKGKLISPRYYKEWW